MVKIQLLKLCPFRFSTFTGSALFWLLASYPVSAQIVPDTTVNTIVTPSGNTFDITGGTQRGSNLFHSFQQFSVPNGGQAFFKNAGDIQNIISRVTGRSVSNIDGLIRTLGMANLFLINPNGIVFGPNASLDIKGSFVASTANSLRFADGTEFSATNPQADPLLTISVPLGLQFGSNPGGIVSSTANLQVPSGKTLALVGGNVTLEGGNLTAVDGRIELGSVGTGSVNLSENLQGLEYSGVQNFQDIKLSDGARVEARGQSSGGIQVQGRNINLTGGAQISSRNSGAGTGGTLTVNAAESVNLSGDNTSLLTSTSGIASAGNLTLTTRKLTVKDGASIATVTNSPGSAGDLLVRATDVQLSGTTTDGNPSGLSGQVQQSATGKGGNLTIETGRLRITDGAAVDASTFGEGQAGNILVKATDAVELVGEGPNFPNFPSGIFAQVAESDIPNAGDAGTLTIKTGRLTVQDGAQISTAARKGGNGGELSITADSITLSGVSPQFATVAADKQETYRSGIFVSAEKGARGNVGNLNITSSLPRELCRVAHLTDKLLKNQEIAWQRSTLWI
ncbi:filamentous hemagglutinin outer membrane protein [Kalymmatonema gypsitolerans NIES-4073]|nr:filamentous hemagglutinin outer membrane protein [Scytonema sp. NIES-4073]